MDDFGAITSNPPLTEKKTSAQLRFDFNGEALIQHPNSKRSPKRISTINIHAEIKNGNEVDMPVARVRNV